MTAGLRALSRVKGLNPACHIADDWLRRGAFGRLDHFARSSQVEMPNAVAVSDAGDDKPVLKVESLSGNKRRFKEYGRPVDGT
jgi:hypothetical protein